AWPTGSSGRRPSPPSRRSVRCDVAALIPGYQAGRTVADVVAGARGHVGRVLVVDDGSQDDTGARAAAAGAEGLCHAANTGKGAAIVPGLRAPAVDGVERALTMDADGQHLAAEIPVLLAASDADPHAIVVGVRRKAGHPIRRLNRFGNWIADRLLRLIAG